MKHQFLWFAVHTTGMLASRDHILEWALALAEDGPEGSYDITEEFSSVVHVSKRSIDDAMPDPFVRNMHTVNGLWQESADSEVTLAESDDFLFDICCELVGHIRPRGLGLGGYNVAMSILFATIHLPKFASCLTHAGHFDIACAQAISNSWYGVTPGSPPVKNARAADKVRVSLQNALELRELMGPK